MTDKTRINQHNGYYSQLPSLQPGELSLDSLLPKNRSLIDGACLMIGGRFLASLI